MTKETAHSLFRVAKDEFPEFEISQTDAILVAIIDDDCDLVKESNGFRLRQSFVAANV